MPTATKSDTPSTSAKMAAEKPIYCDPTKRHDAIFYFANCNGNPNGDPDLDNQPRMDNDGYGIITAVCLKRKVRDLIATVNGDKTPYGIYITRKPVALNSMHQAAYDAVGVVNERRKTRNDDVVKVTQQMLTDYWDLRMFGGMMDTDVPAGVVTGPLQFTFSTSIGKIRPQEITISRVAITKVEERQGTGNTGDKDGKKTELGKTWIAGAHALYACRVYFTPSQAVRSNVTPDDLELFWDALCNIWDFDHSAARGEWRFYGADVFTHDDSRGNAHAHELLGLSKYQVKPELADEPWSTRDISDYVRTAPDPKAMPKGVTHTFLK